MPSTKILIIVFVIFPALANVFRISYQSHAKIDFGEVNRFRIDYGNPDVICPGLNYSCDDGRRHFVCTGNLHMNPKCVCFSPVAMPVSMVKVFVQGTNGIRNKVALDYNIANMNLIYWSKELMNMATQYLLECRMVLDPCRVIGEKVLKLSQNRLLLKSELTGRWPGRVVRHWFLEIGPDSDWDSVERRIYQGMLTNFTNIIYPLAEFMGCGGARLHQGFFIVCYFYPAFDIEHFEVDFVRGKACSNCVYSRPTCSRLFNGLCGVDYEVDMNSALKWDISAEVSLCILYMFHFCMFFVI